MNSEETVADESVTERVVAGRYRLLSRLGEGGMGTVWRARDEVLHREVAVKEVRAPAGLPAPDIDRMYTRLEREAWAAARVGHPNVITIYDVVTQDSRPWIIMELVRGRSLGELLRSGPLGPEQAAGIAAEVLAALRAAHAVGVLHRDVKPANVLLAEDGRVVLTDFGIAMVSGDSSLTRTGEVVGSPEYLPPERALGQAPGPASDLWSLGILLYAAVEGISPYRQDTPLSTLRAIVDAELPPVRRAGPLGSVIEGLLRKPAEERIHADRAEQELRRIAASDPANATADTPPDGVGDAPTTTAVTTAARSAMRPVTTVDAAVMAPAPTTERSTRRRYVMLVPSLIIALAAAGFGFALSTGGDEGGAPDVPASTGSAAQTAGGAHNSGDTDGAGEGEGPSGSAVLSMQVTGTNNAYVGACPPSVDHAPTFTVTFAVDKAPVQLTYRWVSQDGAVVDPQWRTISFTEGGPLTKQESVRLTTWSQAGTLRSQMSVQLNDAQHTRSNAVPFSLSCT
ncbi:protein kinase domain-containing protein [Streptomyces sp. NPDC002740]